MNINWSDYNNSLKKYSKNNFINECHIELHNMTMRRNLLNEFYRSSEYISLIEDLKEFDSTDFDYFHYEKELVFGKTD